MLTTQAFRTNFVIDPGFVVEKKPFMFAGRFRGIPVVLKLSSRLQSEEFRIGREAEAVARGAGLEGTVVQHVFCTAGGKSMLATRRAPWTLLDRLRQDPFDVLHGAEVGLTIALTLTALHRARIFHLDIKLENLLLDDNGCPLLCDFGLCCKRLDGTVSEATGTKGYVPRVREAGPLDAGKLDVYALGRVFQNLFFRGDDRGSEFLSAKLHWLTLVMIQDYQAARPTMAWVAFCLAQFSRDQPPADAGFANLTDKLNWLCTVMGQGAADARPDLAWVTFCLAQFVRDIPRRAEPPFRVLLDGSELRQLGAAMIERAPEAKPAIARLAHCLEHFLQDQPRIDAPLDDEMATFVGPTAEARDESTHDDDESIHDDFPGHLHAPSAEPTSPFRKRGRRQGGDGNESTPKANRSGTH